MFVPCCQLHVAGLNVKQEVEDSICIYKVGDLDCTKSIQRVQTGSLHPYFIQLKPLSLTATNCFFIQIITKRTTRHSIDLPKEMYRGKLFSCLIHHAIPNEASVAQGLTDLPEVRDGVRQGALGGNVGRHPGVVLNLRVGGLKCYTGSKVSGHLGLSAAVARTNS